MDEFPKENNRILVDSSIVYRLLYPCYVAIILRKLEEESLGNRRGYERRENVRQVLNVMESWKHIIRVNVDTLKCFNIRLRYYNGGKKLM